MKRLTLSGNTFSIKEQLKAEGFKWNPTQKAWYKDCKDAGEATDLMIAYEKDGVSGMISEIKASTVSRPKHYMVKESWIFNLEAMHDKVWCLIYDVQDGNIKTPFEVAGKTINDESDLHDILDEASTLESKAKSNRGVTGEEYGRIKQIVAWRVEQRYAACMANGMDEAEAGRCFEDM